LAGTFLPETDPSRAGPRHWVHSWALVVIVAVRPNVRTANAGNIFLMARMINQRRDHFPFSIGHLSFSFLMLARSGKKWKMGKWKMENEEKGDQSTKVSGNCGRPGDCVDGAEDLYLQRQLV
jgi:hypothetical protein